MDSDSSTTSNLSQGVLQPVGMQVGSYSERLNTVEMAAMSGDVIHSDSSTTSNLSEGVFQPVGMQVGSYSDRLNTVEMAAMSGDVIHSDSSTQSNLSEGVFQPFGMPQTSEESEPITISSDTSEEILQATGLNTDTITISSDSPDELVINQNTIIISSVDPVSSSSSTTSFNSDQLAYIRSEAFEIQISPSNREPIDTYSSPIPGSHDLFDSVDPQTPIRSLKSSQQEDGNVTHSTMLPKPSTSNSTETLSPIIKSRIRRRPTKRIRPVKKIKLCINEPSSSSETEDSE